MDNYITYHLHSDYSLLDSCTKFKDYADLAMQNGQIAIASTEHGKPLGWVSKKMYCDSIGLRFIHGVEIYLTESLDDRVRDNYHTVLLAKNLDGVRELNRLVSLSCDKRHFYYNNRISFDEFTSLCIPYGAVQYRADTKSTILTTTKTTTVCGICIWGPSRKI